MPRQVQVCEWTELKPALQKFVDATGTQSQAHIRPLHWHVASRLVLEGGFHPDEITPRPPFVSSKQGRNWHLHYDPASAGGGELSVLGGLKTKQVDVTVCKEGVGPVIAVSMKGTQGAFRNLTNRMEEAVGDCTNLHLSYPALVYGFMHVIRATPESAQIAANDIAIRADGSVTENVARYGEVLSRLTGRDDIRDVATKYEAVCLALINPTHGMSHGQIDTSFPGSDLGELGMAGFFDTLYHHYDQRFVFAAPALSTVTRRVEWHISDAIKNDNRFSDFAVRLA